MRSAAAISVAAADAVGDALDTGVRQDTPSCGDRAPGSPAAKHRVSPDAAASPPSLASEHVSAGCMRRPGVGQGQRHPRVPGERPVTGPEPQWHVAECLLPGLSRATAEALGRRVRQELAGPPGTQVTR
jgi:hypothetical protein